MLINKPPITSRKVTTPRTQRQHIAVMHNWRIRNLKGAIAQLNQIIYEVLRDGGTIKYNPKLEIVEQSLRVGIETAYELQCEKYPLKRKTRLSNPT